MRIFLGFDIYEEDTRGKGGEVGKGNGI